MKVSSPKELSYQVTPYKSHGANLTQGAVDAFEKIDSSEEHQTLQQAVNVLWNTGAQFYSRSQQLEGQIELLELHQRYYRYAQTPENEVELKPFQEKTAQKLSRLRNQFNTLGKRKYLLQCFFEDVRARAKVETHERGRENKLPSSFDDFLQACEQKKTILTSELLQNISAFGITPFEQQVINRFIEDLSDHVEQDPQNALSVIQEIEAVFQQKFDCEQLQCSLYPKAFNQSRFLRQKRRPKPTDSRDLYQPIDFDEVVAVLEEQSVVISSPTDKLTIGSYSKGTYEGQFIGPGDVIESLSGMKDYVDQVWKYRCRTHIKKASFPEDLRRLLLHASRAELESILSGFPPLNVIAFKEKLPTSQKFGVLKSQNPVEEVKRLDENVPDYFDGYFKLIPNANTKSWSIYCTNTGSAKMTFTLNYFSDKDSAQTSAAHDDNSYGHGILTRPQGRSFVQLTEGDRYAGRATIEEDGFVRIGIRGAAFGIMKLPPLGAGAQMMTFDELEWYNDMYRRPEEIEPKYPVHVHEMNADGASLDKPVGAIHVTSHKDEDGQIKHWDVSCENTGNVPFIGTIAFENSAGKNDGVGLHSMAVPAINTKAVQRIYPGKNYGVTPQPGEPLRIGIRGYSHDIIHLPHSGRVTVQTQQMNIDVESSSSEYFDKQAVSEKRAEKIHYVDFYEDERYINQEIEPITYYGAEALARSTYDAPSCLVQTSDKLLVLEMENSLPAKDNGVPLRCAIKVYRIKADGSEQFESSGVLSSLTPHFRDEIEIDEDDEIIQIKAEGTGWTYDIPVVRNVNLETNDFLSFREDHYSFNKLIERTPN